MISILPSVSVLRAGPNSGKEDWRSAYAYLGTSPEHRSRATRFDPDFARNIINGTGAEALPW